MKIDRSWFESEMIRNTKSIMLDPRLAPENIIIHYQFRIPGVGTSLGPKRFVQDDAICPSLFVF